MMLRLIADDLTGALDSAAEFAGDFGAVRVAWQPGGDGSLALDSGTREATRDTALFALRGLAPALDGAAIAFKKIDSLLRGHPAAELAACLGGFRHCVIAPAFPAMGRVTRGGTQYARDAEGGWVQCGALPELLAREGIVARVATADAALPDGVSILDADIEADLARVVACGRAAPGAVLWCGSGGLAAALATRPSPRDATLRGPVLGLLGSDQPIAARQFAACGPLALRIPDGGADSARRLATLMQAQGAAFAAFALPEGTARDAAARHIARALQDLVRAIPRPGTLVVTGGETLRALCAALGAVAIEATGILAPGLPRARLVGGAWDGVSLISKSGAFGGEALWRDLLAANGFCTGTQAA